VVVGRLLPLLARLVSVEAVRPTAATNLRAASGACSDPLRMQRWQGSDVKNDPAGGLSRERKRGYLKQANE
jgi:hypothetical protein